MDPSTSWNPPGISQSLPPRRRVWQACINCRSRKTRCDAAKPRCSLCTTQDVECVYADSQQPRIEYNTWLILDRMQTLEERLLASPNFSGSRQAATVHPIAAANTAPQVAPVEASRPDGPALKPPTTEIPISSSHTANANHVLNWPIVQDLLSTVQQSAEGGLQSKATAVFFGQASAGDASDVHPPDTWRLFGNSQNRQRRHEAAEGYLDLIRAYFDQVNVFFPLLSYVETVRTLERVVAADEHGDGSPSVAQYCLLLLALCMGSFVSQGQNRITLMNHHHQDSRASGPHLPDQHLWRKAQLLLGYVASQMTIEAAQCTMLASIYMGARGRVPDSFHWSHVTSVKCATLVKRLSPDPQSPSTLPEALRRLYWVTFIYEGDFMSEISITLPSGIARYEDQVPYPTQSMSSSQDPQTVAGVFNINPQADDKEELVAFQISTNAAIRRLLNRVHSMVYDSSDQFRLTRVEYVDWLLRVSEDFWAYHESIYHRIPRFLFVSQPEDSREPSPGSPLFSRIHSLSNNPWNILRLKGRYEAAKHIIHRPFFDYVLLNMEHIQTHPNREAILQKCGLCLEGCRGFFSVFDVDKVNSVTCLFATGMATFTYLVILRVATLYPVFQHILPNNIEEVITTGKRNLQRFSASVREFVWHLELLERLDLSCKSRTSVR